MFNIGGGELVVIAIIALIVLGPERLPSAAREVGKAMTELRSMSRGFKQELTSAIDFTAEDELEAFKRGDAHVAERPPAGRVPPVEAVVPGATAEPAPPAAADGTPPGDDDAGSPGSVSA